MVTKIRSVLKQIKSYIPLIAIIIVFYIVYYLMFDNATEVLTSMIDNIVSVPFSVLITGILFNYILNRKDREREAEKVNMLVGVFYSEIGNSLLDIMVNSDECIDEIRDKALITPDWKEEDYIKLVDDFEKFDYCINLDKIDFDKLKLILDEATPMIIDLLSGNVLQNKEEFTEIIVAVFHLRCEIDDRYGEDELAEYEKEHLEKDIDIVYKLLAQRWVEYMAHIQNVHPQLFVKALIKSPFDNRDYKIKDYEILKSIKK